MATASFFGSQSEDDMTQVTVIGGEPGQALLASLFLFVLSFPPRILFFV
jgi:hypothetical protein